MANANSSNELPPRDVIPMRVEAERCHIFQAQAICSITSLAAHDIRDSVRLTSRGTPGSKWRVWLLRKRPPTPNENDLRKVIIATDKATPIRQPDADRAFVRKLRCVKVVIDRDYAQANEDLAPRHQLLRASTLEIRS
jgi:hypothetical protein